MSPMSLGRSGVYFIVTDERWRACLWPCEAGNDAQTVGGGWGWGEHSQSPHKDFSAEAGEMAYLVSMWLSRLCPPAAEWQQAGPSLSTARGALSAVTVADGLSPAGHVLQPPGPGQVWDSLCGTVDLLTHNPLVTTAAGRGASFPVKSLAGSCLAPWVLPGRAQSRCPWGNGSLTKEDAAPSGQKLQSAPSG